MRCIQPLACCVSIGAAGHMQITIWCDVALHTVPEVSSELAPNHRTVPCGWVGCMAKAATPPCSPACPAAAACCDTVEPRRAADDA